MKDKIKSNLNVIIFSIVNFLAGLVCLLIIKNPVPISIAPRFIVGEIGSKWILLLFLFLGLLLGFIGLVGRQNTPEQVLFARKRQLGINALIVLWTVIVYFFLCLFTSLDIIGSRVRINIASMIVCLLASMLALYTKHFLSKQSEDMFCNYRRALTAFVGEICGYVLLVVAAANIFIDSLFFILPFVVVAGLVIYLLPLFITQNLKKKADEKKKITEEESAASDEKILNAVNFASNMSSVKDKPKKPRQTQKKTETEENAEESEQKPVELAEEKVVSKTQAKKLAKQNATKNAQKASGNKTSNKQTAAKPKAKQSAKKSTKTSSNYKGTSKTKNIKK